MDSLGDGFTTAVSLYTILLALLAVAAVVEMAARLRRPLERVVDECVSLWEHRQHFAEVFREASRLSKGNVRRRRWERATRDELTATKLRRLWDRRVRRARG